MDIRKELDVIKRTGKFVVGGRQSYLLALNRKAKLILLAKDCPETLRRRIMVAANMNGIKVMEPEIESREMGLALGKPFHVAVVAVTSLGSSSLAGEVEDVE